MHHFQANIGSSLGILPRLVLENLNDSNNSKLGFRVLSKSTKSKTERLVIC